MLNLQGICKCDICFGEPCFMWKELTGVERVN